MSAFQDWLAERNACSESLEWLGARTPWQAWHECPRADWLVWLAWRAGVAQQSQVARRRVVLAAAACAWRVAQRTKDKRVHRAVDVARRVGLGSHVPREEIEAARSAAWSAAWSAWALSAARSADAAWSAVRSADAAWSAARSADAAWSAARSATPSERSAMARDVRHLLGWPRIARALRAQGMEVES